jgi:tRNA G18 (ribose-2'-O)-methylase SpoU
MPKAELILIAHNLRSAHNVGSLLRTAEGLGLNHIYLSGYTPYPARKDDDRLPHIAAKVNARISKTALGAEHSVSWSYRSDIFELLNELEAGGWQVAALEQTPQALPLQQVELAGRVAIIVGREVEGIEPEVLAQVARHWQIPMSGGKESFNVAVAAAMALYLLKLKGDGQIGAISDKI